MRLTTISLLFALIVPSNADNFVTLGLGFSGIFYKSHDFDQFAETYNLFNREYLAKPLQSFDNAFGLRWNVGIRGISKLNYAIITGYLSYVDNSSAVYGNGERRDFKFNQSSFFIDTELGYTYERYLINGVMTFYFNRNSSIESSYAGDTSHQITQSLSGTYKALSSYALDLGVSFGIIKEPFLIIAKITYPVYTGGSEIFFRDQSLEKVQNEIDGFPRDYFAYVGKEPYPAVRANIDGLKFLISLNYMIPLKSYNGNNDE